MSQDQANAERIIKELRLPFAKWRFEANRIKAQTAIQTLLGLGLIEQEVKRIIQDLAEVFFSEGDLQKNKETLPFNRPK